MSWDSVIPLKKRGESSASIQNFLSKNDQFFIMDNHRAALWCWLQRMKGESSVNFLHIDAHWDCLQSITPEIWSGLRRPVSKMTIDEYLTEIYPGEEFELFRWDNYIPPFLTAYKRQILKTFAASHGIGTPYPFDECIEPHNILNGLENIFYYGSKSPWIVNIDCDYFFTTERRKQLYTDEVIIDIASQIRELNNNGQIICCTIALSPECCGGWDQAERVASMITSELGIPFALPTENP